MDHEQQQLLLKRLSDLKTPQKTVRRILYALESKDKIIDHLSRRAQVADELQSQCERLEATVQTKIKESELLALQLQEKQEHVTHLERLLEFVEQQTNCRTRQLLIQQQQQNEIKQSIEAKHKQQSEDWMSCIAELKYELASAKVDHISAELRNNELEEQIHLLSEDKAHVMEYYEERIKQMEENLKQEQSRNDTQLVKLQKRLEEKDKLIGELERCKKSLENTIERLPKEIDTHKSIICQSPRRRMSQSPRLSPAICNTTTHERNYCLESTLSSLQHVESSEDIETVLTEIEHSNVKEKNNKARTCGQISSPVDMYASKKQDEESTSSLVWEETEQQRGEMMDTVCKENQGNVHNLLQTAEEALNLQAKKHKNDQKKRSADRKVKGTNPKSHDAIVENVQTKRKKRMTSEKNKKSGASSKDASFGLYSVGNDISSGDSLVGSSYGPNSAMASLRIPQLAFSMSKDGKVVFDAFKP
ncbi:hypothetical protein GpartN1_g1144.t1 [Galdieria partita]|uniref:Uncharacterized protein n=1 Tax=Galdieria partita TaxID=83374 RepID=A0A9C7UN33_9RHOD|nr:hypothetical protein GpartN1_g1144.t1 [Galdieria partita]